MNALYAKAKAEREQALMALDLLENQAVGIGDHTAKDFMEDAVSASTTSSLNDIQFGNFHVKFASGAYSELAVVYTGIMNQESEDSITDTLMAFEIENSGILDNWDGDLSKLENSTKYLEKLFGDIDKEKN